MIYRCWQLGLAVDGLGARGLSSHQTTAGVSVNGNSAAGFHDGVMFKISVCKHSWSLARCWTKCSLFSGWVEKLCAQMIF